MSVPQSLCSHMEFLNAALAQSHLCEWLERWVSGWISGWVLFWFVVRMGLMIICEIFRDYPEIINKLVPSCIYKTR